MDWLTRNREESNKTGGGHNECEDYNDLTPHEQAYVNLCHTKRRSSVIGIDGGQESNANIQRFSNDEVFHFVNFLNVAINKSLFY